MRVLVTNEDGVASPGLHRLARALADDRHDVVVAAPDGERSGSAAAIGQLHVDRGIDAERVGLPGLDGVPAFAVAGPPGLCVLAARLGGFGEPPDLVASGINPGCNTGRAVLHSGTVGAALTASNFGCRGVAVSIDVSALHLHEGGGTVPVAGGQHARADVVERVDAPTAAQWGTAAAVAAAVVGWLAEAPQGTVLNVNVPNLPLDRLRGVQSATLAPFGTVRSAVVEAAPDGGRLQLELRPTETELPEGCDTAVVKRGLVAVTALTGIGVDGVDLSGLIDRLSGRVDPEPEIERSGQWLSS